MASSARAAASDAEHPIVWVARWRTTARLNARERGPASCRSVTSRKPRGRPLPAARAASMRPTLQSNRRSSARPLFCQPRRPARKPHSPRRRLIWTRPLSVPAWMVVSSSSCCAPGSRKSHDTLAEYDIGRRGTTALSAGVGQIEAQVMKVGMVAEATASPNRGPSSRW